MLMIKSFNDDSGDGCDDDDDENIKMIICC